MNHNKPAFFKCMECNFRYIIDYDLQRESFFYSNNNLYMFNSLLNSITINIILFCISLFIQTITVGLKFNPIYLIDPHPTSIFLKISNGETLYGHIYYYSIVTFISSFIAHNFFLISSVAKVVNRKKYWDKMLMRFILHYIFANQFILMYYIWKAEHKSSPKTFLNFQVLFNIFFLNIFGNLLLAHNKILNFINSKNAGMVKNREQAIV